MEKIKAVQIVKPGALRVIEMDMPRIDAKNNVLVKIKAAGVCGSDAGIYHGTNAAATYPRVIGHEMVGEVVEVGPTAKKVRAGDRVIIDQVTACGHCYAICPKDAVTITGWGEVPETPAAASPSSTARRKGISHRTHSTPRLCSIRKII